MLSNAYLNLLNISSNHTQIPNFMKIRLGLAELFHSDGRKEGQTDSCDDANRHILQLR
jgi:hypothetical protein